MIGFERDDGGRAAAGFRGKAGDCVARAIAIVADAPYREVYDALNAAGNAVGVKSLARTAGTRANVRAAKRAQEAVLAAYGFERIAVSAGARPTLTEAHAVHGDCIARTNGHVMALVGGAVRDTWDCRITRPPFNAERKAFTIWRRPDAAPAPSAKRRDWRAGLAARKAARGA